MTLIETLRSQPQRSTGSPVQVRLHKLATPAEWDAETLTPHRAPRSSPVRWELLSYRQGLSDVSALSAGWAAHSEVLADGRRQIVHLVLPGEIIAYPRPGRTLAMSTVIALTPVQVCAWRIASDPSLASAQRAALGANDALEHRCMINQIARIGRRSAYERMAHLLLEIGERLSLSGVAASDHYLFPLTQETIADILGLTPVHVNRTLQQLRQENRIRFHGGEVEIRDAADLARVADYQSLL